MATETELVVKIAAGGAAKAVGEVAKVQSALKQMGKETQDTAALAKKLGQAYNLPDEDVQALSKALGQAKTATERVTDAAGNYRDALGRLRNANGKFVKDSVAGLKQVEQGAQQAGARVSVLERIFQGIAQGVGQQLTQIGFQAFTRAIGTVRTALASSIAGFAEFDGAIRQVGVISNSTGTPAFAALTEEITRLGIVTSKTPQEIAATAVALSRAGFKAEETAAALEGIARASEATGEALETVGDIVAKTIRSFGLAAEESGRVADVLVTGANNANTSVSALGEALKFAAPSAAAANQSLEGTVAILGSLADAGLQGSIGGTGLAGILDRLKSASAGANSELTDLVRGNRRAVQALNLIAATTRDADGNMRDLIEVLPEIGANLQQLSKEDQDIVSRALFGVEPGRAFQVIANATERTQELFNTIRNSEGAAVRAGEQLLMGLSGALNLIGGSIATLQNQLGEAFAPALEGAVRLLTDIINNVIEAGDAFKAVEEAGTRFTQALQSNPQIAAQLAQALSDVAQIISQGIAAQLDSISQALRANPTLIQGLAQGFVGAAQTVGQFVGALLEVAKVLGSIGASVGGVAGSILTSLLPTFTALTNVLQAAVDAVAPLLSNTQLLTVAFQALLIQMVAVRAVALAQSFAQIAAGMISLVQGAVAATASVGALSVAQTAGSRSSLLLAQSLATSSAGAGAAAASYRAAAASALAGAAKFALLAAAVASVSLALSRFKQGGQEFIKAQEAIEEQLINTQIEMRKISGLANTTAQDLLGILPKDPPPTDFIDLIVFKLNDLNARIDELIGRIPGLQAAVRTALSTIPGGAVLSTILDLPQLTTNAEKQVNDYKNTLADLIAANDNFIAEAEAFNGTQSQSVPFSRNFDANIAILEQARESLDVTKLGTDAYIQFRDAIDGSIDALKLEKAEFQRRFDLVDTFSDLADRNQRELQEIQTRQTNATRELIESNAGQREILNAEKKGYEDRIRETQRYSAQLRNALEEGILPPEEVAKAQQGIRDAEAKLADERLGLARVNQEIAELVTSSTEQQVASLEGLVQAAKDANAQLEVDQAEARATLLEAGGDPAALAALEKEGLDKRLENNKAFLKQLQDLAKGQAEGSEDALETQEQIRDVELAIAQDRIEIAQQVVEERKRLEEEAAEAAEEAAQREIDAIKLVAAQRQAAFDEQTRLLQEEAAVAQERSTLAQGELDLEREKLETALAAAELANNELEADRIRSELVALNNEAIQQQFEAKREQLAIEQQLATIEAERVAVLAEIAVREAEINLAKAERSGASTEELENLRALVALERQAADSARDAQQFTEEVNDLKGDQLDVEEEIARENQAQAELSEEQRKAEAAKNRAKGEGNDLEGASNQSRERGLDLAQQIAEAEERRANALIGALKTEQQSNAESLKALQLIRDRFREAQQAGLFRGQGAEFERAANQLQNILSSGGSLRDLIQFAQNTESEVAKQLLEGIGRGDVLQLVQADEQLQQPLVEGGQLAGNELEQGVVRGGQQAADLLAGALGGIQARRDGGPVRPGMPYLVGEEGPELITPRRGGFVYTAKQTAAMMSSFPRMGAAPMPGQGNRDVVAKLDELLRVVKARPPVRPQTTFNLSSPQPVADAAALQLAEIRALAMRRGL